VIANGAPGAGKTTLARPLARALGLPLISKDPITEAIADVLGPSGDLQWSSRLGAAAFEVMWAIARETVDSVLEGNFGPESVEHILTLPARPIEIYCSCRTDDVLRRFRERAPGRHPIHLGLAHHDRLKDRVATVPPSPLNIGPVLEVDTSEPVDIGVVEAWVREQA
jgi:hypothetical protein